MLLSHAIVKPDFREQYQQQAEFTPPSYVASISGNFLKQWIEPEIAIEKIAPLVGYHPKFIQAYKGSILTAVLIVIMSLFMLSSCAPFQLNLPGSCSIFSDNEKATQNHEQATVQKNKKGLFEK